MRIWLYHCPLCRHYREVSERMRKRFMDRGACAECLRTQFFRFRCHIAFLEDSLLNPDGSRGGRLARLAAAHPEKKEVYRILWRKRERQREAAQTQLKGVTA